MQDSLNILLPEISDPDYIEHHGVLGMKWGVRRYEKELAWKKRNAAMANIAADKRTGKITKKEAKSRRQIVKGNLKADLVKSKAKVKSIKDRGELKKLYNKTKEKATREIPYNRFKKISRVFTNTGTALSVLGSIASGTAMTAVGATTANPILMTAGLTNLAISTPITVAANRIARGIDKRMYY